MTQFSQCIIDSWPELSLFAFFYLLSVNLFVCLFLALGWGRPRPPPNLNRGIEADKPPASSTHQYQWYHCCYRGREGNAYFFIVTRFATVIFPIFVIWELPSYTINYTIPYHTLPFNNIPSQSSIFNISLSMTPPPNYPFNNKQYQTIPYHTRTFKT